MAKIAITCGDPAGVGPEVIASWLYANRDQASEVCLLGPESWLGPLQEETGVETQFVGPSGFDATPGNPTVEGARVAFDALEAAASGCREGRYRAAVTGPVSKEWMRRAGFNFPGQTEFFADRWGGEPVMAFASDKMRVVLATWHIPLSEVPAALTETCLARTVCSAATLARAWDIDTPYIGVCGLNPHAGEKGLLGSDEQDRLDPVLDRLRPEFPGLSTCQPADTLFWRHMRGEFDVVVALYHDQGLAPLKAVDFDTAVNITLGLPWVRTSPDHGTGFGIAGKGTASHSSLANAVKIACLLASD